MKVVIIGGGPAGLYCSLLIKKARSHYDITVIEHNPADVTYGWGVVFSDSTLASFQRADYQSYEQITDHFVIWDAIDVYYRDAVIRCGGHVIASISRKLLLHILQQRCAELGVILSFNREVRSLSDVGEYDLLIAADGIHSVVRQALSEQLQPEITAGNARYIWLGTNKILDAFTFIFRTNEHGFFQVHAYPSSGISSTFIVECDEATWLRLSNHSQWLRFPTLKTRNWHTSRVVLLGDAVHTAHFSIGSGTKLAMEDAIALAHALELHSDLETALNAYELERKPVVEMFQKAAQESQTYFETIKRYQGFDPMPFAFQLLTRSGRVSYDDLRLRDPHFGDAVNRWWAQQASISSEKRSTITSQPLMVAPPPLFSPLKLRSLCLTNRVALAPYLSCTAQNGVPCEDYMQRSIQAAQSGMGLLLIEPVAIAADARITPECAGLYCEEHLTAWTKLVQTMHERSPTKIALHLGHAGRRGATQPRRKGLDRPLHQGNWSLISASPLPYTSYSQVPREMDQEDMQRVCERFVQATRMAQEAAFDLLILSMAHGYLLASFLSPLTNRRNDAYGGDLERRMRYPLTVFAAVRAAWPVERPLAVALTVTDYVRGGLTVDDAVTIAGRLKEQGCDLIVVQAGQTTPQSEPPYGRGFLTPLSDQVRNRAGIPTLVGGYLATSNDANTILAAGRADLCIMNPVVYNKVRVLSPPVEKGR